MWLCKSAFLHPTSLRLLFHIRLSICIFLQSSLHWLLYLLNSTYPRAVYLNYHSSCGIYAIKSKTALAESNAKWEAALRGGSPVAYPIFTLSSKFFVDCELLIVCISSIMMSRMMMMKLIAMITHVNYYIRQMLAVCRCRCQRQRRQRHRHRHRVGTWRKPQSGQPTKTEATKCNWFCCIISTAFSAFAVCRPLHSIYWRCAVLYCCQQSQEWRGGRGRDAALLEMPQTWNAGHEQRSLEHRQRRVVKRADNDNATQRNTHKHTHTHVHRLAQWSFSWVSQTKDLRHELFLLHCQRRQRRRQQRKSNGGKINL